MKDLRWAFGTPDSDRPVFIHAPGRSDSDPSLAIYPDHGWDYGSGEYYPYVKVLAMATVSAETLPEYAAAGSRSLDRPPLPHPAVLAAWSRTLCDPASPRYACIRTLEARGLLRATVRKAGLGHTGTHFSIPVFKPGTSTVLGIRFRKDDIYCDPDQPRYTQPRGQPALLYRPAPRSGPPAICEGEFDTLLLSQLGVDAMTSTAGSGSLAKMFKGWPFKQPVYVCTDQDEAGEKAYEQLAASGLASGCSIKRVTWPTGKDVTDELRGLSIHEQSRRVREWFDCARQ